MACIDLDYVGRRCLGLDAKITERWGWPKTMSGNDGRVEQEIDAVEYLLVVWRYKWVVMSFVVSAVAITAAVTLQLPKMYESTTTILMPREGGANFLTSLAVSGLVQQAAGISVPSLTPNRDALVSILKSRTMADAAVEKFNLMERYHARFSPDAAARLQGLRTVTVSRDGVILISVLDTDPAMAAAIANYHVEHLDRLVNKLGVGEASRQRLYLTEQLARAKGELAQQEESLRRFQERNKAIVLPDQTREAIDAAARLKGEIIAAEVQLQVMKNFATESNPDVVSIRRRVKEMRRQLARMQYGDELDSGRGPGPSSRRDIYVPFAKVPEVGLELTRQTRDLKVQETLVTLLSQQLEQAKLAEARDTLLVQALDPAIPALRPSKPNLKLNVGAAGVGGLVSGILIAFMADGVRRRVGRSAGRRV